MSRAVDATIWRRPGWPAWRRLVAAGRGLARRVGPGAPRSRRGTRRVVVVHSDIVSSTHLLEAAGPEYPGLLLRHRALIAAAVVRRGGEFLSHAGYGTLAVFDRADRALLASVEAQRALAAEPWPEGLVPRVRMGVHVGDIFEIEGEPVGLAAAAEAATYDGRPRLGGFSVADAGWHTLRDHAGPVRLRQVVAAGLTVVLPESGHTIDLTAGTERAADVEVLLDGAT